MTPGPADLLDRLDSCVATLRRGEIVVITDRIRDIGVVGIAGSRTTAQNVNFLIQHCRGIVYGGAAREHLDRLGIGHQDGADVLRSQVYVAVDAVADVTTGVSAADRATTIRAIIDRTTTRAQLRTPGHVLPSAIDTSGRVESFYFNEALQYLITMAGLGTGLALSAVLAADGSMASAHDLLGFAAEHNAPCIDFTEVLRARRHRDGWSEPWPGQRTLTMSHLRTSLAITAVGAHEHHAEYPVELLPFCMIGHALRAPVPCRDQLEAALERMERRGTGAVALAWPAGARGQSPDHAGNHEHRVNPALAGLIAAELAAALPQSALAPATTR
jgi:3,4-dihydroxy 2-butanone 4-phosphate synthase/GTP cyclohydrolase II